MVCTPQIPVSTVIASPQRHVEDSLKCRTAQAGVTNSASSVFMGITLHKYRHKLTNTPQQTLNLYTLGNKADDQ